ncbi:MAG TPA: hypothetical protein VNY74_14980 [Edaphobacter sp.]|jgi:hypothetical protein|nr:hypothetical protein [Edaphobacter sp.]
MKFLRILLSTFMLSAAAFAQPHDGRWWQSTLEDQRNEYLNGYMDCAVYDGGRRDLPSVGTVEIAQAIQAFYDSNPKMANASVVTVLKQVSKQKGMHRKPLPGGEVWTNKHAYYDGEYWPISDMERTGFVQGLRECYASLPSEPRFSKGDAFYVGKITAWYSNPKRSHRLHTSIANVLALYADRKQESEPSKE